MCLRRLHKAQWARVMDVAAEYQDNKKQLWFVHYALRGES